MADAPLLSSRLLAERGFLYDSSLMDSDWPYELATPSGSIVESLGTGRRMTGSSTATCRG